MLGITGRCHCLMLICEVQVESAQQHCTNFMMCRSDHEKVTTVKGCISFDLVLCSFVFNFMAFCV